MPFMQNKHQIQSYPAPTSNSDPVGKEAMTVSLKLSAWMISHPSKALWYLKAPWQLFAEGEGMK